MREINPALFTVKETAEYLNIGMTQTRELMKANETVFIVKLGNRRYAHKLLLDRWLLAQVKIQR